MRLTRLQLQGFKSFASRCEVDLGAGITAIVGPNGSGKSNLVDAIRLVLGGASARELRGQRLDQIIFAGGDGRASLGMAEVTILLDNQDGRLPVEDLEVAITRRVFRDGTSEFRRNGSRIRMRDLGRLLEATGLTQAGYAVIAQNDIEAIIRATPGQRRHLVEEAAGVRGAQALLEDSRSRMGSLQDWLDGADGRLAELLPRIDALREEAVAAEEAAGLRGRLAQLRGSLERAAWLAALAECQRLERKLLSLRRKEEQAAGELAAYEETYRRERAEIERSEAGRLEGERRLGELALRQQRVADERSRLAERAIQAARDRHGSQLLLAEARGDLESLEREAAPGRSEGDGGDLEEKRSRLNAAIAKLELLERSRFDAEEARLGAQREARRRADEAEALDRRVLELRSRLVAGEAGRERARDDRDQLAAQLDSQRQQLGVAGERVVAAGAAESSTGEALARALQEEAAARQLLSELQAAAARAAAADGEASAAVAGLRAALAAKIGGRPIAELADRGELGLRRISHSLAAKDPADATAIDAALGSMAEALSGPEEEARKGLALAGGQPELVGWPVDSQSAGTAPPGCRELVESLDGPAADLSLVRRLCPGVGLAGSRPAADLWLLAHPEGRAVLPDGTVLGRGWERTAAAAAGLISKGGELRRLEDEARRRTAAVAQARQQLAWATEQEAHLRAQVDSRRSASAEASSLASAARRELERLEATVGDLAQRAARAEEELGRQEARRDALEAELTSLSIQARAASDAAREAAARAAAPGVGGEASGNAVLGQRAVAEELRAEVVATEVRQRAVAAMAEEWRRRREQLWQRIGSARGGIASAEAAALAALTGLKEAQEEVAAAGRALEMFRAEAARGTSADPLQHLAVLERRRAELQAAHREAAGIAGAAAAELDQQRLAASRLQPEDPEADGGSDADGPGESPERCAQEIARIERRLAGMGPLNELAPGQLRDLLNRTAGLRAAHEDVVGARSHLEAVAALVGNRTATRYRATLDEVSKEFASVWSILFGGGRAAIVPIPDQGGGPPGVDLEVQPRGKRPVPLALLSGGERSLTALAMVLALQQVSPSPFYVFDEVDAALDEANVAGFGRLLRERAVSSQFLLVTHNVATMAMADQLYGVTQDGKGGSRLLSVRLARDGKTVEIDREAVGVGD